MSEEIKTAAPEEAAPERDIVYEEAIEAILFAAGHPITYTNLARVLNLTPGKVKDLVVEYARTYNTTDMPRGVILLAYEDSCQLCTKQYYLHEIREALGIKKSGTLSTSSMEALAIVAYNQPVTRMYVDTLRRADSSYAMNNLIDRGLIECKGRMDVPGRPMLYGTTNDFLRCFGLGSLADLPGTSEELMALFAQGKNVPDKPEEEIEGAEQLALELEGSEETAPKAEEGAEEENAPRDNTHTEDTSAEDDIIDYE
jgi:segregation and condensation protein B